MDNYKMTRIKSAMLLATTDFEYLVLRSGVKSPEIKKIFDKIKTDVLNTLVEMERLAEILELLENKKRD